MADPFFILIFITQRLHKDTKTTHKITLIMDAQLIERLDQRRYKTLLWQTIGFAVFFAGVIAGPHISGRAAEITACFITGLGVGLFLVATFKSSRNERAIKSDPELREALNNELIKLYRYKALMWSFYTTLATAFILYMASEWWTALTARLACVTIIYTACLSLMIARLIYLKR